MFFIDTYAENNAFKDIHTLLKIGFSITLMGICLWADHLYTSVFVAIAMFVWLTVGLKLSFLSLVKLLKVPFIFLLLGSVTMAFQLFNAPTGVVISKIGTSYLCLTWDTFYQCVNLFFKGYSCISCLYLYGLSTPISHTIYWLQKLKIPSVITQLMYLIYRYIFLLADTQNKMTISATARLGYSSYKKSWYTFSALSGNLLATSFKRSRDCLSAMEARGFEEQIQFFSDRKEAISRSYFIAASGTVALAFLTYFLV